MALPGTGLKAGPGSTSIGAAILQALFAEAAARLAAITEMYPKRQPEELLGELIGAALEELEKSFPYVKGSTVVATDEEGDPLYEDIGPTPRFLALSRRHLHDLSSSDDKQKH